MPKNMKYDAVATKAAGPKKKMKSNQDGGSVTAKDPAAAGKQLAADQTKAAGPAKTRDDRKKSAKERKIKRKTASASKAAEQMGDAPIGSKKETRKLNKMRKKVGQRNALQEEMDGPGKMGYSQKFGPGRMNGYDAGAKKVMSIMKGGAKMMAEGPGQAKDPKDGDRVDIMTSSDDGKTYKINVNSNAEYAKFAGKVGGLPHNLRAITTFNENTDPKTSGISEQESKRRLKAYKESLQKTDVKSGSYMRKSTYLPKQ